jgi:hypothetical protein
LLAFLKRLRKMCGQFSLLRNICHLSIRMSSRWLNLCTGACI